MRGPRSAWPRPSPPPRPRRWRSRAALFARGLHLCAGRRHRARRRRRHRRSRRCIGPLGGRLRRHADLRGHRRRCSAGTAAERAEARPVTRHARDRRRAASRSSAARARLMATAQELQERLSPKTLARDAWQGAKEKGADLAEDAVDAVKRAAARGDRRRRRDHHVPRPRAAVRSRRQAGRRSVGQAQGAGSAARAQAKQTKTETSAMIDQDTTARHGDEPAARQRAIEAYESARERDRRATRSAKRR